MSSQKQIDASRANGALSRGPETPEGKARSARNATRHGLLSKVVVLRNENHDAFQTLFEAYTERLGPLDAIELGLVEEMVAAYWRLHRAYAIEHSMFDDDLANVPPGDEAGRLNRSFGNHAGTPKLNVLLHHQARLQRTHSRALRDLALMRHAIPPIKNTGNEPEKSLVPNKIIEIEPDNAANNSFVSDAALETEPGEPKQ